MAEMTTDLSCAKATPFTVFPRLPLVANLSSQLQDGIFPFLSDEDTSWWILNSFRQWKSH